MDADLDSAGADQLGIHQAERTTCRAPATPAARLKRRPARATMLAAAGGLTKAASGAGHPARCRRTVNWRHDPAAAAVSAATICPSTWQARLTWLTDAPQ
jgi:hypothetical protein